MKELLSFRIKKCVDCWMFVHPTKTTMKLHLKGFLLNHELFLLDIRTLLLLVAFDNQENAYYSSRFKSVPRVSIAMPCDFRVCAPFCCGWHTWPRSHTTSLDIVQPSPDRTHLRSLWLVIIKDYIGAFDRVTAAQCRGLSCEIEAKCASHNKRAPKPWNRTASRSIPAGHHKTRGPDLKRLE